MKLFSKFFCSISRPSKGKATAPSTKVMMSSAKQSPKGPAMDQAYSFLGRANDLMDGRVAQASIERRGNLSTDTKKASLNQI